MFCTAIMCVQNLQLRSNTIKSKDIRNELKRKGVTMNSGQKLSVRNVDVNLQQSVGTMHVKGTGVSDAKPKFFVVTLKISAICSSATWDIRVVPQDLHCC